MASRILVVDQSATSRQPGDHLATTESTHLIGVGDSRHWSVSSIKPFCSLCDLSAIVFFFWGGGGGDGGANHCRAVCVSR